MIRIRVYLIVNGLGNVSKIEITGGSGNKSQGEFLAPENKDTFFDKEQVVLGGLVKNLLLQQCSNSMMLL